MSSSYKSLYNFAASYILFNAFFLGINLPLYSSKSGSEPISKKSFFNSNSSNVSENNIGEVATPSTPDWFSKAKEVLNQDNEIYNDEKNLTSNNNSWDKIERENFKYIGQAFNLFLIVEKDNQLFLIDQHAAHERILFDQIRERQNIQNLLIPIEFEVDRDVDNYLNQNLDIYLNLGIKIINKGNLLWQLNSIPAVYKPIESKIIEYIKNNTGDSKVIEEGIFAVLACHNAIKQGDNVDEKTAISLIEKVFELDEPVCPHGRTFLIRFDQEELMKAVGRT